MKSTFLSLRSIITGIVDVFIILVIHYAFSFISGLELNLYIQMIFSKLTTVIILVIIEELIKYLSFVLVFNFTDTSDKNELHQYLGIGLGFSIAEFTVSEIVPFLSTVSIERIIFSFIFLVYFIMISHFFYAQLFLLPFNIEISLFSNQFEVKIIMGFVLSFISHSIWNINVVFFNVNWMGLFYFFLSIWLLFNIYLPEIKTSQI